MIEDRQNLDAKTNKENRAHLGVGVNEVDNGSVLIPKIGDTANQKETIVKENKSKKYIKLVKPLLGVFLVLFLLFVFVGLISFRVYKKALMVQDSVEILMTSVEEQNLPKMKAEIEKTRVLVLDLKGAYKKLTWLKAVPFVGKYVADGEHGLNAAVYSLDAADVAVGIIEPYADIIGLVPDGGDEPESGQETAQDRIDFVIKTIPDVIPRADELITKVGLIKNEVDSINPDNYPEKLAGKNVRERLKQGIEMIDTGSNYILRSKPLLEVAQSILGVEETKTYLVLFQNDKELRPTGGFLTAYSIAKVDNGRFEPVMSDDIYNLDNNYTPSVKAPQPLIKYIKGPYVLSQNYRLRDMNWSPDFAESMGLFTKEAKKAGINNIDGVIAVDTQVLVYLLDAMGPIGVSGYGEFSTNIVPECNCPQVIYELESFADIEGPIVWSENTGEIVFAPPNYDNRKKIIGPLMNSVLSNALGQSKENLPKLFEAVFKSVVEKHVLFYMFNEDEQIAVEEFGIAGIVDEYDKDYLMIVDANLGGRKSNLYVTQEVSQAIEITKDQSIEKTLTITYKNPEKHDGWLNSILPNWVRIYVPKGSELISTEGLEDQDDSYNELGKTVFAGFFKLRPQGVSKVVFRYKLPSTVNQEDYSLLIQKQPGKDSPLYLLTVGTKEEEFFLKTDREIKIRI